MQSLLQPGTRGLQMQKDKAFALSKAIVFLQSTDGLL